MVIEVAYAESNAHPVRDLVKVDMNQSRADLVYIDHPKVGGPEIGVAAVANGFVGIWKVDLVGIQRLHFDFCFVLDGGLVGHGVPRLFVSEFWPAG